MYIDAHSHLDHYSESDLIKALEEIDDYNIYTITNSMDLESYNINNEIATKSDFVIPAFGIHPFKAKQYVNHLKELLPYMEESTLIGEIGLDFNNVSEHERIDQMKVFEFFLENAKKMDKFVNIHTNGTERYVFDTLRKFQCDKVIIHWYRGDIDTLCKMIENNYYFTINSEMLKNDNIIEIIGSIPNNRILVETDGPNGENYFKDRVIMPREILRITRELSKIKDMKEETLKSLLIDNFQGILKD